MKLKDWYEKIETMSAILNNAVRILEMCINFGNQIKVKIDNNQKECILGE
ncbi:MAG: hypothetical protein HUJ74_03195 [Lachnospiraceae bacterium]|nr:hypothetical protein [Lachnospiraceae bacterium]